MENFVNDFQTSLSAAIADGVTTAISVVSGVGAPAPNFRIRVDDELMLVTSVGAGTNWTVTRGAEGSAAVAHSSAAVVTHVLTSGGFTQKVSDLIAAAISTDGALLAANNLSDLQSASAARTSLGLGSAALLASSAILLVANNLSDLNSASAARGNLGLGSAALVATSSLLQVANNLSDVASAATSATNLGLGAASAVTHGSLAVTGQLTSQVATGTAPLVVSSTTQVANLNASQLIGATWASPGAIGGTAAAAVTGTTITATAKFLAPDNGGTSSTPSYSFVNDTGDGWVRSGSHNITWYSNFAAVWGARGSAGIELGPAAAFAWNSAAAGAANAADLLLLRDAANTLAQKNGVNAQAFRLYNTFTDASNYERLGISWASNICTIQAENLGTGSARQLIINLAAGGVSAPAISIRSTNNGIYSSNVNVLDFVAGGNGMLSLQNGSATLQTTWTGGTFTLGLAPSGPITDRVGAPLVIAAGSGAGAGAPGTISFQTPTVLGSGTTQQTLSTRWKIDAVGNLLAGTDNSWDVGAAGATRPRNLFVAGGVCLKVKAGAPVDGDFTNPTDGMIAGDSTNTKFWIRLGGAWKGVVVA